MEVFRQSVWPGRIFRPGHVFFVRKTSSAPFLCLILPQYGNPRIFLFHVKVIEIPQNLPPAPTAAPTDAPETQPTAVPEAKPTKEPVTPPETGDQSQLGLYLALAAAPAGDAPLMPDFSPMRNRGKNRQRRGLPPPCGIHPAVLGIPASSSLWPLAWWGHIDGMAVLL